MSFSDDEPPPANSSAGPKPIQVDRVRLVAYSNNKAPLEENKQQVLLEITDTSSTSERCGLDLVAVLDVSGSMAGGKLNKLKTAMKFVISKLGPMDRLSIVSFSTKANKQCSLRSMTGASQEELKDIVEKLEAGGYTNMRDGLETGLKVLADRRYSGGRVSSIVLMSDGHEQDEEGKVPQDRSASDATIGDVAVYTFGFGEDHDAKVLGKIASKSQGGTFHYVRDEESLSVRFAEILAGLLSVVVQDLKLTVRQQGHSTIEKVDAGSYHRPQPPESDYNAPSVNISFGDLGSGEVRKVIVHLLLPAVHREYRATAIVAQCSYRTHGKAFYAPRDHLRCFIHRTGSARRDAKNSKVEAELDRLRYVNKIAEASATEDHNSVHGKLEEAQKVLDAGQPNPMIDILRTELEQLLKLKYWKDLFASLLAYKMSHERQRGRLFATPRAMWRMLKYTEQADKFDKDPNKPPPSVDDDVKEEAKMVMESAPVADQPREPRTPRIWGVSRERRSSGWAWAMVILCTVLAIGVIVAGAAVFAVYILFKPKMPYLVVSDAQLRLLQYDQEGTIQSLQMSITILAENNNSKADASFFRVDLALGFHGADVALLRAEPFVVARENSLPLQYNVVSAGRALDPDGMQAMDESLKAGVVPFDLFGKARTRWKVGVFVKLRFWTRISCRLRFFFPGNGTVMPTDRDRCRSRSP
ncbi:E3 ubiquitin-protein ligase WAV3-like [Phragmites australis]|uniref:E3 ubiquitin-protein ligase WAV3-like n=1 Tax=Phragmites australis TaxID=29695 RepID=UPI002D76D22E|nr:E3 ubiquitin-protein ligase WAV3-like [Phragmites australis]